MWQHVSSDVYVTDTGHSIQRTPEGRWVGLDPSGRKVTGVSSLATIKEAMTRRIQK